MTVTLTYDPVLSRVQIAATGLAAADVATVERSTDGVRWTTVRGGGALAVVAGSLPLPLSDYEFPVGVLVTYRVRGIETGAITYVGAGAASAGADSSRAPAFPASMVKGDLIVVAASTRNSGTGTVNTPAGYTALATSGNVVLLGKVYDGVESAPTITFASGATNETTLAQIAVWRRAGLAITSAVQLNGSAQNVAYPLITPPVAGAVVVVAGWKQDDFTSVATLSGLTEIGENSSTLGSDASMVWDYVIQTTAAAVLAGSFVVTGGGAAISRGLVAVLPHAAYLNEQTATITPAAVLGCGDSGIWLKSITRPFLNLPVQVVHTSSVETTRPARTATFPIMGSALPVAVSDVRQSRRWTLLMRTATAAEADNLDLLLTYGGGVLYVQVPVGCTVIGGYVAVGDVERSYHPLRPQRVLWSMPVTEVAAPGPGVVGPAGTWQTVLSLYATWADLIAAKATWADVLALVGSASDVITP